MSQSKVWYPDLLKCSAKAKAKFIKNFENYDVASIRKLYSEVFNQIEKVTISGDVDSLKSLNWFVDYISSIKDEESLCNYSNDSNNPLQRSNIVNLICKNNNSKLLEYLFGEECKLLFNLTVKLQKVSITPTDEDDDQHNAVYYAIRSNNIELLDILIHKWPNDYFNENKEELDELLSSAYKELKLKNIALIDEMQVFVENLLINLRFYFKSSKSKTVISIQLIKSRIQVLTESIEKLDASSSGKVDERFICLMKFIARNVYILKRQLKCTYSKLPWEEIEFCLIAFVGSHTTDEEINLLYSSVLNKMKIITYLNHFSDCLNNEVGNIESLEIKKLSDYPQLQREAIIKGIAKNSPLFDELYADYNSVRDIHSLETVKKYIALSLSADPMNKEGQLVIVRTLQVIGENFKNTVESPKLSSSTCEMLLSLLPRSTRQIIIDLRNSLSHSYSLEKRLEIEENADADFFKNIQNDVKKISIVITEILLKNEINVIKLLLHKIIESDNLDDLKETIKALCDVKVKSILPQVNSVNLSNEIVEIGSLVKELGDKISDKTYYEAQLLKKIEHVISFEKNKFAKVEMNYMSGLLCCSAFLKHIQSFNIDKNGVRIIKYQTNKILKNISSKVESQSLEEIGHTSMELFSCISLRTDIEHQDEFRRLIFKVFSLAESQVGNVKWIAELRDKLNCVKSPYPSTACFEKKLTLKEKQMEHLVSKASVLENALSRNDLISQLVYKFPLYKIDKNLQVVIEMLLLDIMSILEDSNKNLTDNLLFLDEDSPLLVGRNLRNHLAHGNALFDILQNESSVAMVINAKKIISENIIQQKRKIGKLVNNDPIKVKSRCEQELTIIAIQNSLFSALMNGSFEDMEKSIKQGADVQARNLNLWTSLHFASMGGNVKIGTFLLDQNLDVNAVDKKGQTPIHIAAAYGQKDIVQLLLKKNINVAVKDTTFKTPLHLAAQNGHTNVIKLLLRNNACTDALDATGCTPIHYAIIHNHREATEFLLAKQDINAAATLRDFTSLHVAAENGHLELVKLLLKNKANVNAKTDQLTTSLHTASLNGHLDVVKALILAGAQINVRTVEGGTPLHYAVENNHKMIVELLLDHGADVNAVDGSNYTPLNFAAWNGDLEIIKLLSEKKSDINHSTINRTTSLYLAAENGHQSAVQFLLRKNASLDIKDLNSFSVLHIAAHNGHTDIVKLLVENGAKVNDRDVYNRTPLHLAAMNNKHEVVEALISLGANVECKDKDGATAIHISSQNGHQAVVKQLIANEGNVTAQNNMGTIPMFMAIASGSIDIIKLLIEKGADINFVDNLGFTALHVSALHGNQEIVKLFLQPNSDINIQCQIGLTPLHFAVQGNHREVVKMLIEGGAKVDAEDCSGQTPLCFAVKNNCKDITVDLIRCGADTNIGCPLISSIIHNFSDIAQVLIHTERCNINIKVTDIKMSPLHVAAVRGQENVVCALLMKGADVNSTNSHTMTALHCAASEGHNDVVKVLLKNKSKLNVKTENGYTPLSLAATSGHHNVVTTLLNSGANPNIADLKNRTSIEMAVAHNKLEVVKILLKQDGINVNKKGNDDFTLLHIAAQMGLLDITKLLVENEANFNAKNISGSKPIHLAARDGHLNIVEFFLKEKMKLDDLGAFGQTLLHYAVQGGQSEIVKYLINQKMDVNTSDSNGANPIHVAAVLGYVDIIRSLIHNGAYFNAISPCHGSALEITKGNGHRQATKLLELNEKIFEAVKHNNISETEKYLKEGAVVNIKNNAEVTPLHYASWKGFDHIVSILLDNKANPNIIGKSGCTPLHYACKFNHFNIVKSLLLHKAGYNVSCSNRKTPLDFATHPEITKLLEFINESFKSIQNGDAEIISKLKKLKDKDILKIVMNAHNKDNKTLVLVGIHWDFPKMKQLKQVLQDDMSTEVKVAHELCCLERYEEALTLFKSVFEKRKDLFGLDHPDTLEMQLMIGRMLYKQQNYQEALKVCEVVYLKQKEVLGEENADTMGTKRLIALIFHRQGKNEEALALYEEFLPKQIKVLGSNHSDVLDTRSEMALVLCALSKLEEALNVNDEILKIRKKHDGLNHPKTLVIQNNIAMVLNNQGKHKEALEMYKKVYEARKKILGPNHSDTLRTSHWIAAVTLSMKQSNADVFKEVFEHQKNALGTDHLDTLNTQYNRANLLFSQGRILEAFKIYQDIVDGQKKILGPNHSIVVDIEKKIEVIKYAISLAGDTSSSFPQQNDTCQPPSMQKLIGKSNVNSQDENSLTPLHYAVSDGNEQLVKQLLEQGADVMLISNKGNTVLHIAASKGFTNIVDILLVHVKQSNFSKLNEFINTKTTSGGTAALHVAASIEIAISLLKYGAIYNIKNKKGEAPIKVSKETDIVHLLQIIEELFTGIDNGSREILKTLRKLKIDEIMAATTAHNLNEETIWKKAAKYPVIARDLKKLLDSLKK